MGNLAVEGSGVTDALRGLAQPQAQNYQPGIVSSMLRRGEDPSTLPKKSFLAGAGWKPPSSTWSPWDMWSPTDVAEGTMNANRSLGEAIKLSPGSATPPPPSAAPQPIRQGEYAPGSRPIALPESTTTPGTGMISNMVSGTPETQETGGMDFASRQKQQRQRTLRNRPFTTPAQNKGMMF